MRGIRICGGRSLQQAINRLSSGLRVQGIESGALMVTVLPNRAENVLVMMAVHHLGCVYAPLSPRHMANPDEVAYNY